MFFAFEIGVGTEVARRRLPEGSQTTEHWLYFLYAKTLEDPVALFTLALTLSTVGLWMVTWRGIRKQGIDTEILQRAYLTVEPRGLEVTTQNYLIGQVSIKNVGHLPARRTSNEVRIQWSPDRNMTFGELDVVRMNVTIPVATEMPRGTDRITDVERVHYLAGSGYIYVWGKILYEDGFGQDRWLKFCHRYNCGSDHNSRGGIDRKFARYHHEHNDGN